MEGTEVNGHLWINHPSGDGQLYRGARVSAFQLLIFWAFAEIVVALGAAPPEQLLRLKLLAREAREWLSKNEVFFQGEKWKIQLMPFVYPTNGLDRGHKPAQ